MKIILGSKSNGRKAVLAKAGYSFEVLTADIDEKSIRDVDPEKLVLSLANAKADALLSKVPKHAALITADQVVVCNGKILEKPIDECQAKQFIKGYERFPMETVSSLVVTNTSTGKRVQGVDRAKVHFNEIPEAAIDEAIAIGRVMHCAGAMRCEEPPLSKYVKKIEGTTDSTSGLPLKLLDKFLQEIE